MAFREISNCESAWVVVSSLDGIPVGIDDKPVRALSTVFLVDLVMRVLVVIGVFIVLIFLVVYIMLTNVAPDAEVSAIIWVVSASDGIGYGSLILSVSLP